MILTGHAPLLDQTGGKHGMMGIVYLQNKSQRGEAQKKKKVQRKRQEGLKYLHSLATFTSMSTFHTILPKICLLGPYLYVPSLLQMQCNASCNPSPSPPLSCLQAYHTYGFFTLHTFYSGKKNCNPRSLPFMNNTREDVTTVSFQNDR